jgi:general stress protein 26
MTSKGIAMATPAKTRARDNDATEKLFDIIKDVDFCMLSTFGAGDGVSTRPMSTIVKKDEGVVYMLSEKDQKVDDISKKSRVLMTYSDGGKKFAVVEGSARIHDDRALVERLWNPGAQVFWPQGPNDPNVVAIAVRPESGEYWDGYNALVSTWKFASSLVTGSTADMGDNEVVNFGKGKRTSRT